jgi:hypothetical protein
MAGLFSFLAEPICVAIGHFGFSSYLAKLSAKHGDGLMPAGLFRDEDGSVQVDYGTGTSIPIPRSRYEANGYKPDFDKLPSEAEYLAAEQKKEDNATRP